MDAKPFDAVAANPTILADSRSLLLVLDVLRYSLQAQPIPGGNHTDASAPSLDTLTQVARDIYHLTTTATLHQNLSEPSIMGPHWRDK
jgi:hypothetical protein